METTTSPPKKTPERKTDRKIINSEGRTIVARVYHFMKNEAENGVSRLKNATWRTAQATGVSERTVQNIRREEKKLSSTNGKFFTPFAKRKKRPNKTDVDSFTAEIVRTSIEEYKAEHKKLPTLGKLKEILHVRIQFNGSLNTIRTMLLKLGLEWRKLPVKRRPRGSVPPKEPKEKKPKSEKKASTKVQEAVTEKQSAPQLSAVGQRLYPMAFVAPQYDIFNVAPTNTTFDTNYPMPRPQEPVYPTHRLQDPISPIYPSQGHDAVVDQNKLDPQSQYQDNRDNRHE